MSAGGKGAIVRVRAQDGTEFVAFDRAGIVRQMRDNAWKWDQKKRDYMSDVSDRIFTMDGFNVRADTPDNFIADLIRAGLVVETLDN